MTTNSIKAQFDKISSNLLAERNSKGFWEGELSSSALSTAVSMVALKINGDKSHEAIIELGYRWLLQNGNADGGFGDTPQSASNISTSLLVYAALVYCGKTSDQTKTSLQHLNTYLNSENIEMSSESITTSILAYYGKDYTFSVPILTMLVICGIIEKKNFDSIPGLPFELSILPTKFYQFFNLQVVSYAIPALIAVGITIFKNQNKGSWIRNKVRNYAIKPSLKKLASILPESGGFLEAIPLTAFVNLCLNYSGYNNTVVVNQGVNFLVNQQRNNGSWPIDTNLSTWVSTLSIKALGNQIYSKLSETEIASLKEHLLSSQYKEKHPFNNAKPGGWGWTNHTGSVPDGDDTSGAILALIELYKGTEPEQKALIDGVNWLIGLQNRDGGIPTFSKGWGKLPFDASCPDITGHAFLALHSAQNILPTIATSTFAKKWNKSGYRMLNYLVKCQKTDGSWIPLWFGNQHTKTKENKIYGTAMVTGYLSKINRNNLTKKTAIILSTAIHKSELFIASQQNEDGSWGAEKGIAGTFEETALAVSALSGLPYQTTCQKGLNWLENEYNSKGLYSSPIGLYFATLWYDEKLYPVIFYLNALRRNLPRKNS